jgi:hypothetical protein
MPWELDYALLMFTQLKKSKYYLSPEDHVIIETKLNLSDYIIDWKNSKLPKEFFVEKYRALAPLLKDYEYNSGVHTSDVYIGDELYGHLDFQRESVEKNVDYYISTCPDMYFSETLLKNLIDSTKIVNNKYLIITPEIYKLWDNTWDELTSEKYRAKSYDDWKKVDVFDIRQDIKDSGFISVRDMNKFKWAGWFDLYNKAFFEELVPVRSDFKGYGPYDWYGMIVSEAAKQMGKDIKQYAIKNQVVFEYSVGPLAKGFGFYYKDFISLKQIPNQRAEFEKNMVRYINEWVIKNK